MADTIDENLFMKQELIFIRKLALDSIIKQINEMRDNVKKLDKFGPNYAQHNLENEID